MNNGWKSIAQSFNDEICHSAKLALRFATKRADGSFSMDDCLNESLIVNSVGLVLINGKTLEVKHQISQKSFSFLFQLE